ncbi:hypothetical protein [Shewanella violacea]|uniref:Lipoprotein n=1 Tax=Shewanella violacea (strain JCM 10179 / CIP 106290 / LMG 19151 / DSS12) TaxID=637905 RepID=D4ZL32_SHEVD|nr:hypothetical protein [Shewanella violacea]BAJ02381.1 hypothetical protein SVI_2410 [Shewanella violacea DSS12]
MKPALIIILSLMLTACAAPTRTDKADFIVVSSGNVPNDKIPHFIDCLTDGFNKAHWGTTNYEVRQTVRSSGYRVETYTGSFNYLLVSADIFNDGRVVLNESISAGWINTNGEKEAFASCLVEYLEVR